MVIGAMSDTHGNAALMQRAAERMTADFGVSTIFHAGDMYADGRLLRMSGFDVRIVPGLGCDEYFDTSIPRRISDTFNGTAIACTHAEKNLRAAEYAAAVIVLGHTHEARVEQLGRSVFVNPGHLKSDMDRGQRPSFATIAIEPDEVEVTIHEINGIVRTRETFRREDIG